MDGEVRVSNTKMDFEITIADLYAWGNYSQNNKRIIASLGHKSFGTSRTPSGTTRSTLVSGYVVSVCMHVRASMHTFEFIVL